MSPLVKFIQAELRRAADPVKAPQMAAYMRTDMPFYGVQKPERLRIMKKALKAHPIDSRKAYVDAIESLWELPHREEKYLAISIARQFDQWNTPTILPRYERMIREGAWWDFVDELAVQTAGVVYLNHRAKVRPRVERWIEHDDMWLQRSAIICQIKHKEETDEKQLFDFCARCMHETEFFIRKAIGWALREYAYTSPTAVRAFLKRYRDELSTLSFREASKHLNMK